MIRTKPAVAACALFLLLGASPARAGFDLIINGDFSQGNVGFTSQYNYSPADIGPAQTYAIVHSPGDARPADHNGAEVIDHTNGLGLLMAVNGAEVPNQIVWSETLTVSANTDYDFSLWLASWFAGSPATLDIQFNGVTVGTPTAPSTVLPWEQFTATWNSGGATTLTINIIDTNLADIGSDFAIDDISLIGPAPAPAPPSLLLALTGGGVLGGWGLLRRRRGKPAVTASGK